VAERLLRRSDEARDSATTGAAPGRRRRLRAIADADLRERYGGRPTWLEVGGLAHHTATGIVVVWSIGRGMAEVQPLSGGEPHWVRIAELSPPRAG
jgi:hypothetical protein